MLIISFSVIGVVIGIVGLALNLNITRENQSVILFIQTVVLSLILLSISYFCFLNGLWIPTITPIIAAIASLLSISSQYKQSLENLVYGDKVTKTANRKYFDKVFDRIFNAAKKENREIALVLCRINDISSLSSKKYNQSLRKMAEAIGELLKDQNDLVARYDTNSLAVILQNVSHQEADLLVKSIRKNIKSQFKNSDLKFDVDLGFATSSDFSSPMDVLMLANNNLEPRE
ncbi:MAG: GGDEF domain-containing protein [Xenococcaceae cyanobacterium]